MANGFPPYGIIIAGHFCRRVTIYVSFLEQYIREESRALKIFDDLPRQQKASRLLPGGWMRQLLAGMSPRPGV